MREISRRHRTEMGWALAVAVILHLAVVPLFLLDLPTLPALPSEEETVNVALVDPPEEVKPEEKPSEEKLPEEKTAEEKKPEEVKPPVEKPEQPLPPAPEAGGQKPQPEKADEPEKPAPPKEAEKAEKPEAPPPPPAAPETVPENAPAKSDPPNIVGRPVSEFGEEETGPEKSLEGGITSATGDVQPPAETPGQPLPPAAVVQPEENPAEKTASRQPMPQDIDLPQVDALPDAPEKPGPAAEGVESDPPKPAQPEMPQPAPKVADLSFEDKPRGGDLESVTLPQAKKIYSNAATNDRRVRAAIKGLSQKDRVKILCVNELTAQLRSSANGYKPIQIPTYAPTAGTVVEKTEGAFQSSDGKWYGLSVRCQVDDKALKVTSFAYAVGAPVPRADWARRGIPAD